MSYRTFWGALYSHNSYYVQSVGSIVLLENHSCHSTLQIIPISQHNLTDLVRQYVGCQIWTVVIQSMQCIIHIL